MKNVCIEYAKVGDCLISCAEAVLEWLISQMTEIKGVTELLPAK